MESLIQKVENKFKKPQIVDVRSGDTVKVHQKIKEGGKERVQAFQGLVMRVDRMGSLSARVTVRRIASGIGVEKSFLLHSPLVTKVEVLKRSKVRRNYLSYMRNRSGKSARLASVDFNRKTVNLEDDQTSQKPPEAKSAEEDQASTETKHQQKTTTKKADTKQETKPKPKKS